MQKGNCNTSTTHYKHAVWTPFWIHRHLSDTVATLHQVHLCSAAFPPRSISTNFDHILVYDLCCSCRLNFLTSALLLVKKLSMHFCQKQSVTTTWMATTDPLWQLTSTNYSQYQRSSVRYTESYKFSYICYHVYYYQSSDFHPTTAYFITPTKYLVLLSTERPKLNSVSSHFKQFRQRNTRQKAVIND